MEFMDRVKAEYEAIMNMPVGNWLERDEKRKAEKRFECKISQGKAFGVISSDEYEAIKEMMADVMRSEMRRDAARLVKAMR